MDLLSRRAWMGAATTTPLLMAGTASVAATAPAGMFRFCLNTSTISGQKKPLPEMVEIAAKAGYDAIEPWIRDIDQYVQSGGSVRDLAKRIRDLGLTVEDAIGFPEWIVDDDGRRAKGLEEARRAMALVRELGGQRLAAPPVGATNERLADLGRATDRYRALCELGDRMDVTPMVELWGFSKTLNRLGETALVAVEAGHPRASVLADVYHLHKGGSSPEGLKLLSAAALPIFHMNDYPATPERAKIVDADRIYPGDGVAPLGAILRSLQGIGFQGALSLELFNRDYWKQDALLVARTGLEKMKAVVEKAGLSK